MKSLKFVFGVFLYVILLGLPMAVFFSTSFGLPDFHHGNYEHFLIVATILSGVAGVLAYRYLRRVFLRCFSGFFETSLTLFLTVLIALLITCYADPYTYVETRFALSLENKKGAQSRLMGVYPDERPSMPLVGVYSFEPYDYTKSPGVTADTSYQFSNPGAQRDLRNIVLGSPGFEKMYFAVSTHKLMEGVYIKASRNIPLRLEYMTGEPSRILTPPQKSDYARILLPRYIETVEKSYFCPATHCALPGIFIIALFVAVYLRKLAFIIVRAPLRLSAHIGFFLAFMGLTLSYNGFELIYSNDPVGQFRQGLIWDFKEWHPPIMAFIWINLVHLFNFIFGYFSAAEPFCIFMRIPYWLGFYLLARYAAKRGGLAGVIMIMFVAYAPFLMREYAFMLAYAWKDCLLVSNYVLAFGILLNLKLGHFSLRETINRIKKCDFPISTLLLWLTAVLFFIIGTGVRGNALLSAIPLSCLFFIRFFDLKRFRGFLYTILCGALLFIVTFSAIHILHYPILKTTPQTPLSYPMVKEIMAINYLTGKSEWPEFVSDNFKNDVAKRYDYHKHNGGTDGFIHGQMKIVDLPRKDYDQLKVFWIHKIMEHPRAYMEQKWDSFYRTLRVYKPPTYALSFSLMNPWHIFWASIAVLLLTILLYFTRKNRRIEIATTFLIATSALMYLSTYYLFAFVSDFRYMSWFLYGGALAVIYMALLFIPNAGDEI